MSNYPIKSIFEQVAPEVFAATNVHTAKSTITNFLNKKNIKEIDKKTILYNLESCRSLTRVQTYICNSLLKYEGKGLI